MGLLVVSSVRERGRERNGVCMACVQIIDFCLVSFVTVAMTERLCPSISHIQEIGSAGLQLSVQS